jgi:hypothetical protein
LCKISYRSLKGLQCGGGPKIACSHRKAESSIVLHCTTVHAVTSELPRLLKLILKSSADVCSLPLPILKVAALPLLGSRPTVMHFAVVIILGSRPTVMHFAVVIIY